MAEPSRREARKTCGAEAEGLLLSEWLAQVFTYANLSFWEGEIEAGRLKLGSTTAGVGARLHKGDRITWDYLDLEEPEANLDWRLLYEDPDFLVVDKPPNLVCHPGGSYFAHSLWFLLKEIYGPVGFAGRLDRETSGLILVTRNPRAARLAQEAGARGALDKTYQVLVHGDFPETLEARGWLAPDPASTVRKKRLFLDEEGMAGKGLPPGAEAAQTSFRLIKSIGAMTGQDGRPVYGKFSLVEARLGSGRLHQVRASLLGLGWPVVGDKLYGLDEGIFLRFSQGGMGPGDAEKLILGNQALHAARLVTTQDSGLPSLNLARDPPWLDRIMDPKAGSGNS